MKRKILYAIALFTVLTSIGCSSVQDKNEDSVNDEIQTDAADVEEDTKPDVEEAGKEPEENNTDSTVDISMNESLPVEEDVPELYEGDVMEYIDIITDDMLDACEEDYSLESYWNDPIVLLNKYNDDLRLYGISTTEQGAMLLYVQGEKVFVRYGFRNQYLDPPKLNFSDIDSDGIEEVIISDRTITGNIKRYELIVCDYEDIWNVYPYDNYLQDIEETIQWQFDKERNTISFMDMEGNVLSEQVMPEWTSPYPFNGEINYEDSMEFDAEKMLFCVEPLIGLENHSLPYRPIEIVFHVIYKDGEFDLEYDYIEDTYWNQNE